MKPHQIRRLFGRIGFGLSVFALVSPALLVFLWMLSLSLKNELDNTAYPPVFIPSHFSLRNFIDVFEKTLAHEKAFTGKISALFELARQEKDYASEITLQWYVTEQVEEESSIGEIVDKMHAVGDKGGGIWYLDSKMGKRGAA